MAEGRSRRKIRPHQAADIVEASRWQCASCDAPTEHDGSKYCVHCRLYVEDVQNGVFDFDDFPTPTMQD